MTTHPILLEKQENLMLGGILKYMHRDEYKLEKCYEKVCQNFGAPWYRLKPLPPGIIILQVSYPSLTCYWAFIYNILFRYGRYLGVHFERLAGCTDILGGRVLWSPCIFA